MYVTKKTHQAENSQKQDIALRLIEMKKSMTLSITFVIISIALISWTVLVVAAQNGFFADKSNSWASDNLSLVGVTRNDGYYNISLAFSNVNYTRQLQNIMINPNSNDAVVGLKGYINGTAVNTENPVFSSLINNGDSLRVDLLVPCADFRSGTTIYMQVIGGGFGSGGTILLP
jgi:hypothetical protein